MSKRTLLVCEIINLTQETVWVYGTSGKLIELKPKELRQTTDGELVDPIPNTYYIADGMVLDILATDPRYHSITARAEFAGHGPYMERIYKLTNIYGLPTVPITDGIGRPGYIESKSNTKIRQRPYTLVSLASSII